MSRTLYSTAVIALLLGTGGAFAQSSTTTQQPGAAPAVDCPVPGSVPDDQLPANCKPGTTTGAIPATPDANSSAQQQPDPNATPDVNTGSTTPADNSTATAPAAGSTDTAATPPDNATGEAMAPMPAGAEFLASQFMGRTVYTAANENVGEINDLVMNKELDTIVAVIGVGGFLGIGEKDVLVPIDQITISKDASNKPLLTIASTKEQLEAAPAFDRTALAR